MSVPEIGLTSFTPTKANVKKFEQQKKVFNFMTQGLKKTENEKPLTKEEYLALSAKAHKEQEAADAKKAKELYQKNNPEMVKAGKIATETGKVLLAAGTLGASALIGCNSVNQDFTVEADQKLKVIVKPVVINGDTTYIEVPKKYHPEVNDSIVNRLDDLGFKPEGKGDLLGLVTGDIDWENNAHMKSPLDVKQSSDNEMVFKNSKLKLDGREFYGRLRYSLTDPVPGDGKRILVEIEEPLDKPKKEPTDNTMWDTFGKFIIGSVKDGKATIFERNNIDTLGYITKEKNWDDPSKSDLVIYKKNGQITGISDFHAYKVENE